MGVGCRAEFVEGLRYINCQAEGDSGLTSVFRPNVISLRSFWSDFLKKIQFDDNKPMKTKEKITSSERGLNFLTRKR